MAAAEMNSGHAGMSPPNAGSPEEVAARRRRVRSGALKLGAFALLVYVGFIIAFINR
jgi:hypothetical protein